MLYWINTALGVFFLFFRSYFYRNVGVNTLQRPREVRVKVKGPYRGRLVVLGVESLILHKIA